ncbi:MAG: HAD family hydrolase [Chloroflexi bacterium]|nr:HAD family hydrolase [Chloroflexota bacterium]
MPLDTQKIRALCFDVDGTLSDTDDQFVLRLAGWLHPFRALFPGSDVKPFARRVIMATERPGNLLLGIPDRLGLDDELATLADWLYRRGLGKTPRPFLLIPGVRQALQTLYAHYPMSIVSARGERTTRLFLEQFNLQPFFRCVVTAQTAAHTKPFPDPILYAAAQMGVPPEACLMIGDTTVDLRAGKAAGAQTAGVLCGFGEEAELLHCGADVILASTAFLPETLTPGIPY